MSGRIASFLLALVFLAGQQPVRSRSEAEAPASECAGCHLANVANTDMTWIQFYPLLRDKDPE